VIPLTIKELGLSMALTVQQLLADAKKLSHRLREHDQSADLLLGRATHVLSEVEGMRLYQEDTENLNEVAHNRPRAALVLGIQQENRHFRTLQQENKELRAALEEHQSALELIMSKYRQHVTKLVNSPAGVDRDSFNNHHNNLLAERTDKICEMAQVMKEAARADEETCNTQQELLARLVTENKGLREMLEISGKVGGRRGSNSSSGAKRGGPGCAPQSQQVSKSVQTEVESAVPSSPSSGSCDCNDNVLEVQVTLPRPNSKQQAQQVPVKVDVALEEVQSIEGDSDETGSEDESVKYDTIKLANRKDKAPSTQYQNCNGDLDKPEVISQESEMKDVIPEVKLVEEARSPQQKTLVENSECLVNRLVDQLVNETVEVSTANLLETVDTVTVTLSTSPESAGEETTTVVTKSPPKDAVKETPKVKGEKSKPKPTERVKGNKGKKQGNRS